jgi:hypothetical protein
VEIQVAIEGKGVVTINQKVDLDRKGLQKLTTHCADLLKGANTSPKFGFGSGSGFHDEVADD